MSPKYLFLMLVLLAVATASAQAQTPSASLDTSFTIQSVYVGQYIEIRGVVSVDSISPVPLNGYCIYFTVYNPSQQVEGSGWSCTEYTVPIGGSVRFAVQTGILADVAGTWKATVDLYTYDKSTKLSSDTSYFTVIETTTPTTPTPPPTTPSPTPTTPIPTAAISANQIVGYTAIAAPLAIGIFSLLRGGVW